MPEFFVGLHAHRLHPLRRMRASLSGRDPDHCGQATSTCSSRLPPASHPPFSRSYCRHPPTRCRSCRDSKRFWCFAAPFSVTGQPAISLPMGSGRTAGRRPARRRARARGPAAARGRTARDRRAVERSPSTADLTRLRVCRAVQITDVKLIIMATPTRPRSHVTFPAGHPRTPTDYHPLGRDRTGYCWFPLCANRISDLKPPVRTGYFRYVPCHWR